MAILNNSVLLISIRKSITILNKLLLRFHDNNGDGKVPHNAYFACLVETGSKISEELYVPLLQRHF
jgi:hypothetical protein